MTPLQIVNQQMHHALIIRPHEIVLIFLLRRCYVHAQCHRRTAHQGRADPKNDEGKG
jgi:hypothetical protein